MKFGAMGPLGPAVFGCTRPPTRLTSSRDPSNHTPINTYGTCGLPIESTFVTARLGTAKTKGWLSRKMALTMIFRLCQSPSKKRRRLDGSHHRAKIIRGVKFKDGEILIERAA